MPHPLMKWIGNGINVQDDPSPSHRQAAAVNLVSLSDGVTQGRQGNGVEGLDNNNYIIYKINMYIYIYITHITQILRYVYVKHTHIHIYIYIYIYICMCVCAYRFFKNMQSNTKTTHHTCKCFFGDLLLLFLPTSNVTCSQLSMVE